MYYFIHSAANCSRALSHNTVGFPSDCLAGLGKLYKIGGYRAMIKNPKLLGENQPQAFLAVFLLSLKPVLVFADEIAQDSALDTFGHIAGTEASSTLNRYN
jgi:hypothetical protein